MLRMVGPWRCSGGMAAFPRLAGEGDAGAVRYRAGRLERGQRRFHGWLAHGADVQVLGEGVSWEEAVRKADKADFHFMVWTRAVAQVRGADLRPLSAPPKILLALRQH